MGEASSEREEAKFSSESVGAYVGKESVVGVGSDASLLSKNLIFLLGGSTKLCSEQLLVADS